MIKEMDKMEKEESNRKEIKKEESNRKETKNDKTEENIGKR